MTQIMIETGKWYKITAKERIFQRMFGMKKSYTCYRQIKDIDLGNQMLDFYGDWVSIKFKEIFKIEEVKEEHIPEERKVIVELNNYQEVTKNEQ